MGNETGVWMTSCPWKFGDFWKKQSVEIRTWVRPDLLGDGMHARFLGQWVEILTLGREFSWGWQKNDVEAVSIVKIVSLSPRDENLNSKKLINVSYLNKQSRLCFAVFPCIWPYTTVEWFQVFLCNTNYLIWHQSLLCTQLNS